MSGATRPDPRPWSVVAQNLPEHARNPIHTDAGARAAGFSAALVAGVTTYAYLTHPLLDAWGLDWLANGGCEVRFRSPVLAGDVVHCVPVADNDGSITVEARIGDDARPRALAHAWPLDERCVPDRPGELLPEYSLRLGDELGPDYGVRAGDDLDLCPLAGVVHPAVWLALANNVFHQHLVRGAWIHTRSIVSHRALARAGAEVTIQSTVVERFHRSGERAVADMVIRADGEIVALVEHEAIIDLSTSGRSQRP